ncbi:MAG: hypothetical protein KF744_06155 [Taibaiella sp.]|nr:hypothetical protein [Taibaiella sp.]
MTTYKVLIALTAVTILTTTSCRRTARNAIAPTTITEICGCMDADALDYNPRATKTDSTQCHYAIDSLCGIYDVIDTLVTFTSRGPDTTISDIAITVTRAGASFLRFDTILICTGCAKGAIPYNPAQHSFDYTSYSDPYTSNLGKGHFENRSIIYEQKILNGLSTYTPRRWGRGVRRT